MKTLLIQSGRIIDPGSGVDRQGDVWIVDGRIADGPPGRPADLTLDARNLIVSPGFVDCHVAFREPGFEEDETICSGAAAAVAGGFSTVACLPETLPVVDSRASAEFISRQGERALGCRVHPLGAVTKAHAGEELAEIGQLIDGGAVGFSDGKHPIANAEIMRRALQYTGMWGRPVLHHAQARELVRGGVMHEGYHSTVLGLRGMPAAAEEIMVRRDIALVETTRGRLHLMSLSSQRSVEEVRQAKRRGLRVSADVSPHHLLLTDESLSNYDTRFKVDPPFRTDEHRLALIEGLQDGAIEIISSDHQPIAEAKKSLEIDQAPFGLASLETLLPLCVEALIAPGHLSWPRLLACLTTHPAALLGLDAGTLRVGARADITIFDPLARWSIDSSRFFSQCRSTPFEGRAVTGLVRWTIVDGEIRYSRAAAEAPGKLHG